MTREAKSKARFNSSEVAEKGTPRPRRTFVDEAALRRWLTGSTREERDEIAALLRPARPVDGAC